MKLTKFRTITLKKIGEGTLSTGMFTASGRPSVSADALKILAGKIPSEMIYCEANGDSEDILEKVKYGTAYDAFGGGEEGKEACIAIAALCEICSIDSLLSNFIRPLQVGLLSEINDLFNLSIPNLSFFIFCFVRKIKYLLEKGGFIVH